MSSRRRPVLNSLTRGIPKSVVMVAPLTTACLTLLSPHVYGKEVKREPSISTFLGAGRFRIPGAVGG
jgi:hypothetical protein